MKVKSELYGELTYEKKDVIHFPDGLPGFRDEKDFALFPLEPESPFSFMQSLDKEQLYFIMVNPFLFFQDYDFEIPQPVMEKLMIQDIKDVQVYNIVVVKDPFERSTVNLLAPVILNGKEQLGKQAVLNQTNYSRQQRLFTGFEKTKDETTASEG